MKKNFSLFLAFLFLMLCIPFTAIAEYNDVECQILLEETIALEDIANIPVAMGMEFKDIAYQRLLDGMRNCEDRILIYDLQLTFDEVAAILTELLDNEPDLYHVDRYGCGGSFFSGDDKVVRFVPAYLYQGAELQEVRDYVEGEIDYIVSTLPVGLDDYQKALYFHDYICVNYEYDTSYNDYDIYSMLKTGSAVCMGYSLLYDKLLSRVGIASRAVVAESINHMWNQVKINGTWYHVDVTWDDPTPNRFGNAYHDNFLVSDSVMSESHAKDFVADYKCTDTSLDSLFWHEINLPFGFANGNTYCLDYDTIKSLDIAKGTSSKEYSLGQITWTGGSGLFFGFLLGFGSYDNKLIFNTDRALMCYDVEKGTATELCELDRKNGCIISLYVNNSTVYAAQSKTLLLSDITVSTYELDFSEKPVFKEEQVDFSNNGKFDPIDFIMIKRAIMGTYTFTEAQKTAADVNGDGEFSYLDYLLLKRYYLGTYSFN